MSTMTVFSGGTWRLKGVPQEELENIKRQPYGDKIVEALAFLAAIEKVYSQSDADVTDAPIAGGVYAPDNFNGLKSGDDVLCYLWTKNVGGEGHYAILTYFEGGDLLDNEIPAKAVDPEVGATVEQRLLISLCGGNLEGHRYKRFAPQSGFYELVTGKGGYGERRLVDPAHLAGWWPLKISQIDLAAKNKNGGI